MDFLKCIIEWCGDTCRQQEATVALQSSVGDLLSMLNIGSFGFVSDRHDRIDIITNFPEKWVANYQQNELFKSDPVVRSCKKDPSPLIWTETMTSRQNEMFFDQAKSYGLPQNGISSYHFDRLYGGAVFSIAGNFDRIEEIGPPSEVLCGVDLLSRHFTMMVADLGRTTVTLTGRELDVLTWASFGKSAWETGCILGISEGTVNCYQHSAAQKLEATSKAQAVAKAIKLGLI